MSCVACGYCWVKNTYTIAAYVTVCELRGVWNVGGCHSGGLVFGLKSSDFLMDVSLGLALASSHSRPHCSPAIQPELDGT